MLWEQKKLKNEWENENELEGYDFKKKKNGRKGTKEN